MSSKNTARIARDAFAANAIDLLQRALAHGLGARITVDPHGVETHADLFDGDGAVLLTHQLHATQLALPLAGPVEAAPSPAVPAVPAVPAAPAVEAPVADAVEPDRQRPPQRVLIVSDTGADSLGARKGLSAWSAEKTPGAGSQCGGPCAPLVMLHTPLLDSDDVAKILARYAKVQRPVLDLGIVAGDDVRAMAPSNAEIRRRWNAAHPSHRVDVPEEVKAKRAKAGAA